MSNHDVVRPYEHGDRSSLMHLMTEMQGHLQHIDQHGSHRKLSDFDASKYVDSLLRKVNDHHGIVLIAFAENHDVMGCIIGTTHIAADEDLIHKLPHCEGRINEMIVSRDHRGKKVSEQLIRAIEDYFRRTGCTTIRVGCFAPNTAAHKFYHTLGYSDRLIELVKKL